MLKSQISLWSNYVTVSNSILTTREFIDQYSQEARNDYFARKTQLCESVDDIQLLKRVQRMEDTKLDEVKLSGSARNSIQGQLSLQISSNQKEPWCLITA